MNTREWIKADFLAPFDEKGRKNVGVELEFPLLCLNGSVEKEVACGLFYELLSENSFQIAETDTDGAPAFIINADGDVLSFDNSYHNFEFSLEKGESLSVLAQRFYRLYARVQGYFLSHGYTLSGIGTNPFADRLSPLPVSFPVYGMVRSFLSPFSGGKFHIYPDFPAKLSSVQTHLDLTADKLPRALTLFAALDFVHALLFSNSPAFPSANQPNCVCFRDYLWEKSGFRSLAANVGKIEGEFHSMDDVADGILARSMFHRVRNGQYELFPPVSVREYFENGAPKEDLNYYLSFCNIEVTRRGTLEVRSDCAQPVSEAFCPPAFHLGLLSQLEEAECCLFGFLRKFLTPEEYASPHRNAKLRNAVIEHYRLPAPKEAVRELLLSLVGFAERGLKARKKGEEALLAPLFVRAETLTCPALLWKKEREGGLELNELIQKFAKP